MQLLPTFTAAEAIQISAESRAAVFNETNEATIEKYKELMEIIRISARQGLYYANMVIGAEEDKLMNYHYFSKLVKANGFSYKQTKYYERALITVEW